MSRRYWCLFTLSALLISGLSLGAPGACAQRIRRLSSWNSVPREESCSSEFPVESLGLDRQLARLSQNMESAFDEPCRLTGEAWPLPDAPSHHDNAPAAEDAVQRQLYSFGAAGLLIARAREESLAILAEGNSCSAWFAQNEQNPAEKFATLTFRMDNDGNSAVVADRTISDIAYIEPYVARSQENVGPGSAVTLNAHGAFFQRVAPTDFRSIALPHTIPFVRRLHVSDYPGGSLQAQVATLLHEYAHVIGLLPVDSGVPGAALLSMQNTEAVLNHCRKQINASPNRSIVLPASLVRFEQLQKHR